jgi:pilus assembly protein CpaB
MSIARTTAAIAQGARRFTMGTAAMGLVAGVIGVGATLFYMHDFEERASGGRKIALLATAKPVARGAVITEDMLASREVPMAYVDERAIRATDKSRVVGLRATNNIAVSQTVEWTDTIAPSDDQRDLASLVQPGNRALPLRVYQQESLALIRPGDFVDVLAVINGESTVLLQRVLVLATGLDTRADRSAQDRQMTETKMITVSVGIGEGQLLALAMERGRLTAVVRNPNDQRIAETLPDVSESALLDSIKRRELQRHRRGPQATGPIRLEAEAQK